MNNESLGISSADLEALQEQLNLTETEGSKTEDASLSKPKMGLDKDALDLLTASLSNSEPQAAGPAASAKGPGIDSVIDTEGATKVVGRGIDFLSNTKVNLSVELGRAVMYIKDILALRHGSIIEIDKSKDEDVEIYIGNRLLGWGRLCIVRGHYAVEITKLSK